MATATAELARSLAKRRMGEQTFETDAGQSHADATYSQEAARPLQTSEAFAAALQKIRAFERAQEDARSRTAKRSWATGGLLPESSGTDAVAVASDSGSDGEALRDRRVELKSVVRELFDAMISEGLPPNEAAARAILEATQKQGYNGQVQGES